MIKKQLEVYTVILHHEGIIIKEGTPWFFTHRLNFCIHTRYYVIDYFSRLSWKNTYIILAFGFKDLILYIIWVQTTQNWDETWNNRPDLEPDSVLWGCQRHILESVRHHLSIQIYHLLNHSMEHTLFKRVKVAPLFREYVYCNKCYLWKNLY